MVELWKQVLNIRARWISYYRKILRENEANARATITVTSNICGGNHIKLIYRWVEGIKQRGVVECMGM